MKDKNHMLTGIFLSIALAIQLTIVLAEILSMITPTSPLAATVVMEWQSLLRPEWETIIYRFFVASTIVIMALWMRWSSKIINHMRFLRVELIFTLGMLAACFKTVVYPNAPGLANKALIVLMVVALLSKLFWPYVNQTIDKVKIFFTDQGNAIFLSRGLLVLMPVVIFLIIDVPNIQGVVARFFVGEQFHHNDSFIYGPAWAFVSGARLDVDVISQYGVGVGAIFGSLSQLFGGLTYESGLQMMVYGAITYYVLWFFLMRWWLNSVALASAGVFLALKFQLFNAGVYPFAFTYGSATVLRDWFDIVVMFCIFAHIQKPQLRWLIIAAIFCGAQLFYIPSDGAYVLAMFAFYLLFSGILSGQVKRCWHGGLLLIPFLVMFLLMLGFVGPAVLSKAFWLNTQEFVQYFLNGFGLTPIYSGLQERKFLASLMGFVLPAVYVFTLLVVGALLLLRKIHPRNIFACVISVYGLCLYHYYVARSGASSYYVVSLPFVMLLMFFVSKAQRTSFNVLIFFVSVMALLLNQNFLAYPNRLCLSFNPLTNTQIAQTLDSGLPYFNHLYREYNPQLKVNQNNLGQRDEGLVAESDFISDDALLLYYQQESDFSMDAALIDKLTGANEAVPIISSFEIKMLMQAKHRPYFYYFPLAISHPLRSLTLVRSSIYTTDQINSVFKKLSADKPPYIFVERILLTRPLPEGFYFYYSSMLYLVDYVLQNYKPVEAGKYLVALQYVGKKGAQ